MAKRYEYSFQRVASKPVTYINFTLGVHEVVEIKYRKLIRDKAM